MIITLLPASSCVTELHAPDFDRRLINVFQQGLHICNMEFIRIILETIYQTIFSVVVALMERGLLPDFITRCSRQLRH